MTIPWEPAASSEHHAVWKLIGTIQRLIRTVNLRFLTPSLPPSSPMTSRGATEGGLGGDCAGRPPGGLTQPWEPEGGQRQHLSRSELTLHGTPRGSLAERSPGSRPERGELPHCRVCTFALESLLIRQSAECVPVAAGLRAPAPLGSHCIPAASDLREAGSHTPAWPQGQKACGWGAVLPGKGMLRQKARNRRWPDFLSN